MTPDQIRTESLCLYPYATTMVSSVHVGWLNDPEVVKYSEQRHKLHTLDSVRAYVNEIATSPNSYLWGIYHQPDAIMIPPAATVLAQIGTITAHVDMMNGTADMGILMGDRDFWGLGYGSEAWNAVMNWLFDSRDIRKVEAGCHYENRGMRRVAENCGMILEGVRHDHFVVDGMPQHLLLYGKMKPVGAKVQVNEVRSARC